MIEATKGSPSLDISLGMFQPKYQVDVHPPPLRGSGAVYIDLGGQEVYLDNYTTTPKCRSRRSYVGRLASCPDG